MSVLSSSRRCLVTPFRLHASFCLALSCTWLQHAVAGATTHMYDCCAAHCIITISNCVSLTRWLLSAWIASIDTATALEGCKSRL